MSNKKVAVYDGSYIASRLFFAIKKSGGSTAPSAILATVARHVGYLLVQHETPLVGFAFDDGHSTHRIAIYKGYKATRTPNPERTWFVKLFRDIVTAMGVPTFAQPGVEADDIVATLTAKYKVALDDDNAIFLIGGNDKDYRQLLTYHVRQYVPDKNWIYTRETFVNLFGFDPARFVLYQALCGDLADNVPTVIGYGAKVRGCKIVQECATIDEIIANAVSGTSPVYSGLAVVENELRRNLSLVTLLRDLDIPLTTDSFNRGLVDDEKMQDVFHTPPFQKEE